MRISLKCSVKVNATKKRTKTKIKRLITPRKQRKRKDFDELFAHQANAHVNLRQWKKVTRLAKQLGHNSLSEFWRFVIDEIL